MKNKYSLNDTKDLAKQLAKDISLPNIILLHGEIGAGKTTWTSFFANSLGIANIISPTFSILCEYKTKSLKLYHMDLYRLNSNDEILSFGIEDYLMSANSICIIEWANKASKILKSYSKIELFFSHCDENHRLIDINYNN